MKKSHIELLIVALMAIPIGAHGLSAMIAQRLWVAPRFSKPYEVIGIGAVLAGLAWLAMSLCLFATWFTIRSSHRKLGIGLIGFCAAVSVAALVGSLYV